MEPFVDRADDDVDAASENSSPTATPVDEIHPAMETLASQRFEDLNAGFQPLSPRSIPFEQRTGYIVALVVGIVVLGFTAPFAIGLGWSSPWILALAVVGWLLLACILFGSAHFWPAVSYRHAMWRLDDTGLEIRRGVFWKHRIAIPAARVQHVDVSQGPIQRMFRLGKLTINTAGTRNASIELEGLDYDQALQLRDQLIMQKEAVDVL